MTPTPTTQVALAPRGDIAAIRIGRTFDLLSTITVRPLDRAVPFLKASIVYGKSLGITVTRVMTDNGSCYKAFDFRDACRSLGIRHIRTRPYTPKTNRKAERFIQPHSENGPMRRPTSRQTGAPRNFLAGSTNTTGIGRTAL